MGAYSEAGWEGHTMPTYSWEELRRQCGDKMRRPLPFRVPNAILHLNRRGSGRVWNESKKSGNINTLEVLAKSFRDVQRFMHTSWYKWSEILSAVLEPFYPFYLPWRATQDLTKWRKASARTARSLLQWQGHAHHRTNLQASAEKERVKRLKRRPFANLPRMSIEWKYQVS